MPLPDDDWFRDRAEGEGEEVDGVVGAFGEPFEGDITLDKPLETVGEILVEGNEVVRVEGVSQLVV